MRTSNEMTDLELDMVSGGDIISDGIKGMRGLLGSIIAAGATSGAVSGVVPPLELHEPTGGNQGSGSGVVLY